MSALASSGVTSKSYPGTVTQAVNRLRSLAEAKRLTLFAVIDHAGEAAKADLALPETVLVIFGDPRGGTPAMQAVPLVALDLPLKVLIWNDQGSTTVSYTTPSYLAARHRLPEAVAAPLEAIDRLTDALVEG